MRDRGSKGGKKKKENNAFFAQVLSLALKFINVFSYTNHPPTLQRRRRGWLEPSSHDRQSLLLHGSSMRLPQMPRLNRPFLLPLLHHPPSPMYQVPHKELTQSAHHNDHLVIHLQAQPTPSSSSSSSSSSCSATSC